MKIVSCSYLSWGLNFITNAVCRVVPLGPGLNELSIKGIFDQTTPLVGIDKVLIESKTDSEKGSDDPDEITRSGDSKGIDDEEGANSEGIKYAKKKISGWWPLFGILASGVYIDQNTARYRWFDVYTGTGDPLKSVTCPDGWVIIGVRWKSHERFIKEGVTQVTPQIPDIQCAKLIVAEIETATLKAQKERGNIYSTTGDVAGMKEVMALKSVQQCVIEESTAYDVDIAENPEYNTCGGRVSSKHSSLVGLETRSIGAFSDDLFGPSRLKSPKSRKETSMRAVTQSIGRVWGDREIPTSETLKEQYGSNKWKSKKLKVHSDELLKGTLIGGRSVYLVTGLMESIRSTGKTIAYTCSRVMGCEKGTCTRKMCKCDRGWTGATCATKKQPCKESPCGKHGFCSENFDTSMEYTCTCDSGWSGFNCDQPDDKCLERAKDRLTNEWDWERFDCGEGECVSSLNTRECRCNSGFENSSISSTCDKEVSDCVGQWQGGTCNSDCLQEMKYVITVPKKGSGSTCSHSAGVTKTQMCSWGDCSKCMGRDCNGRGNCATETGICKCEAPYKGDDCELVDDQCSAMKCNGHGNCSGNGCICLNNWSNERGNLPNTDGMFCTKNPCDGCPVDRCDTRTGFCACREGTWSDFGRQLGDKNACQRNSDVIDCEGKWGDWTECGADCHKQRYYMIDSMQKNGGNICDHKGGEEEKLPCGEGGCCKLESSHCLNGGVLTKGTCSCLCDGGWQGERCQLKSDDTEKVLEREYYDDNSTPLMRTQSYDSFQGLPSPEGVSQKKLDYRLLGGIGLGIIVIAGTAFAFSGSKKRNGGAQLDEGRHLFADEFDGIDIDMNDL